MGLEPVDKAPSEDVRTPDWTQLSVNTEAIYSWERVGHHQRVETQYFPMLLWTEDWFGQNQRWQTNTVLVTLIQFVSSLNEECFTTS